jgi:two-component system, response regulator, stage 0 sporulation protein F
MAEKGYNILVVDDQMGIRRLLYEAFLSEGYQVDMAGSGFEALAKVKESVPDLVLMDMKMPGMNGLEALQEMNKLNIDLKVIMMTAYGELEIITEAKKLGVKEYITKPFDINEIRSLVKKIIEEV